MDQRGAAALENARWCDLVCRAHGLRTSGDPGLTADGLTADGVAGGDGVWSTADRAPAGYPDAVTTSSAAGPDAVLARVGDRPGCAVKDSFAALDLTPWGFEVLFEARWVHRDAAAVPPGAGSAPSPAALRPVTSATALAGWRSAHGGADALTAPLLAEPSVVVLAAEGPGTARGAEPAAGAVGHRSGPPAGSGRAGGSVVGVSNVFTGGTDPDRVWAGVVRALTVWAPGVPLVGYELEDDLGPALRAGFADVGPLRVWHRPG